jgi:GTP-binding protein Era
MMQSHDQQKCGFVAIIGAPNAGKSTLINRLVGSKVAIVTHKVQTTRARMRAVLVEGQAQIVLVDTPGIFRARRKFERAMVHSAWQGAEDVDLIALVIDAKHGLDEESQRIIEALSDRSERLVLVLNKIDLVKRETLLELSAKANELATFHATFMLSALSGSGVDDLRRFFADEMPVGAWLYPEDQLADIPLRTLAAEITREKLFLRLHDELPYASTVETESWTEKKDGSVRIEQVVYVEREAQRKIVLGKGGQTIKAIGQLARKEIAEVIGQPVHLFIFVKVRAKWSSDPERLQMIGLDPV